MPGNPVSVHLLYGMLIKPFLEFLCGSSMNQPQNFKAVVNTYIQYVSKFNTTAFLNDAFMDSLFEAKGMYKEESEYSQKIVSLISLQCWPDLRKSVSSLS